MLSGIQTNMDTMNTDLQWRKPKVVLKVHGSIFQNILEKYTFNPRYWNMCTGLSYWTMFLFQEGEENNIRQRQWSRLGKPDTSHVVYVGDVGAIAYEEEWYVEEVLDIKEGGPEVSCSCIWGQLVCRGGVGHKRGWAFTESEMEW